MQSSVIKKNVTMALLTAMCLVLTNYLSLKLGEGLIIGFGVIPIVVCAMLYGGVSAGICYSISNLMRVILSGYGLSPYDIPLTFICFLTGLIYGIFLYKKQITLVKVLIPTIITCLVFNLLGNTYFFAKLMGQGYLAILPARVLKNVVQIPINTFIILSISKIKPIMNHAND